MTNIEIIKVARKSINLIKKKFYTIKINLYNIFKTFNK
jgi:hypothetical protein